MKPLAFAALLTIATPALADPAELKTKVDALANPTAIYIAGGGKDHGAASGQADAGRAFTIDTPIRIASNTKTFVAATVLRLWEQGRIDLDAPIGPLIDRELNDRLTEDGYDTAAITVRHLLSHSAGLYDHGSDPKFVEMMKRLPHSSWTRGSQIAAMVKWADPKSKPGTEFSYSDDGYILLGDIIERITGKNLAAAVREQLGLDKLGLKSAYWEVYEQPRPGAPVRARQYLGEKEVTQVHASFDLYGGGGLVMSARDLAMFMKALFEGEIFARPQTIGVMLGEGSHAKADVYRMGIFVRHGPKGDVYYHSGFWGTWAGYSPETGIAVAGMTLNQQGFPGMRPILDTALAGE